MPVTVFFAPLHTDSTKSQLPIHMVPQPSPRITLMSRYLRTTAGAIAVCLLAGCASTDIRYPTDAVILTTPRPPPGKVGLAFSAERTVLECDVIPMRKADAALEGAASGVGAPLNSIRGAGGEAGAYAGAIALAMTPLTLVSGAISGAVAGLSSKDALAFEQARTGMCLEIELGPRLAALATTKTGRQIQLLAYPVPEYPGGPAWSEAARASVIPPPLQKARLEDGSNVVLALRVLRLTLRRDLNDEGVNPRLTLSILIKGRLLRTDDAAECGTTYAKFESTSHRCSDWAAREAQLLREEWDAAIRSVATQIADWLASAK